MHSTDGRRRAQGLGDAGDKPIFVTADGRPRRRPRWLARAFGSVLIGWVASVVVGASGFLTMPALPALPAVGGRLTSPAATRLVRLRDRDGGDRRRTVDARDRHRPPVTRT